MPFLHRSDSPHTPLLSPNPLHVVSQCICPICLRQFRARTWPPRSVTSTAVMDRIPLQHPEAIFSVRGFCVTRYRYCGNVCAWCSCVCQPRISSEMPNLLPEAGSWRPNAPSAPSAEFLRRLLQSSPSWGARASVAGDVAHLRWLYPLLRLVLPFPLLCLHRLHGQLSAQQPGLRLGSVSEHTLQSAPGRVPQPYLPVTSSKPPWTWEPSSR